MSQAWLRRAPLRNAPVADAKAVDTPPPVQTPPRTSFLDLPYEIRRAVYCGCIPRRTTFNIRFHPKSHPRAGIPHRDWPGIRFGLLRVCRQVSDEALDILYGENAFEVVLSQLGQRLARPMFPQSSTRRIRHVLLLYQFHPQRLRHHPSPAIDPTLWDPIFPNLKTLIIAEDTATATWYQGHTESFTPIVEYIGKMLPAECTVLFDLDQEWVERLFRHLPHQSRRARILMDICDQYQTSAYGGSAYWRAVLPNLRPE